MATKKANTAGRLERKIKPQRASDRAALPIDCAKHALRDLMTEQCRIPGGFATYYEGTRAQFIEAGFPERTLPGPNGRRTKLRLSPGLSSYQAEADAWLTPADHGLELEIHWSAHGPGGCAHPALTEIARMAMISVAFWSRSSEMMCREVPTERLLERETDYRLSPSRRFEYTPAFASELLDFSLSIKDKITRGELTAIRSTPTIRIEPDTGSLDAERGARALLARVSRT